MSNSLVTGLAVVGFSAFEYLLGYLFERKRAYSQGYLKGVRDRENEIFTDYVVYMSMKKCLTSFTNPCKT